MNWGVPVIVKKSDVTDLGSGYYASNWFGPSFPEDINWLYSLFLAGFMWLATILIAFGSVIRPRLVLNEQAYLSLHLR